MRNKILAFVFAAALPVGVALVIGIAMFAAVGMFPSPRQAEASHHVVVVISGDVAYTGNLGTGIVPLGFPLHVGAQASGEAGSLSGQGFDVPTGASSFGPPGGPPGYCRIPLTGTLAGNVVTLSGVISFAHNPGDVGVPVTFTADASNGSITFDFGGFIFTGTGRVVIAHQ